MADQSHGLTLDILKIENVEQDLNTLIENQEVLTSFQLEKDNLHYDAQMIADLIAKASSNPADMSQFATRVSGYIYVAEPTSVSISTENEMFVKINDIEISSEQGSRETSDYVYQLKTGFHKLEFVNLITETDVDDYDFALNLPSNSQLYNSLDTISEYLEVNPEQKSGEYYESIFLLNSESKFNPLENGLSSDKSPYDTDDHVDYRMAELSNSGFTLYGAFFYDNRDSMKIDLATRTITTWDGLKHDISEVDYLSFGNRVSDGGNDFEYLSEVAIFAINNKKDAEADVDIPINTSPVANNDAYELDQNTSVIMNVLANDSDLQGDTLNISAIGTANHGVVTQNHDGTLLYTPHADFFGIDTFSYTITDGDLTHTTTVNVIIHEVIVHESNELVNYRNAEMGTTGVVLYGAFFQDNRDSIIIDLDAQTATTWDLQVHDIRGVDFLSFGNSLDEGGSHFLYISEEAIAASNGDVDEEADPDTPVNTAPEANDNNFVMDQGTTRIFNVLQNDIDAEGDTLSISELGNPTYGSVSLNPNGTIRYTADPDYSGSDSFTYTISDGASTSTATVTITINEVVEMDPDTGGTDPVDTYIPVTNSDLEQTNRAFGNDNPTLASNLAGNVDWSTQMPFIDLMKSSRAFFGHLEGQWGGFENSQLVSGNYLDDNGWVMQMPDNVNYIETIWDWGDDAPASRQGIYELRYEGEGELQLNNVNILSEENGRIVFENVNGNTFSLSILEVDPNNTGNYIRDITIVHQDNIELHEAGAIFNPDFLNIIQDLRQLRFMDLMDTNFSELSNWQDRPQVGDVTWTENGVPVEILVELANQAGTDPWFTFPYHATDEYIVEFTNYVKDNLDPSLTAHYELSNEVWNWVFDQAQDALADAQANWGVDSWGGYYVKKAVNMALLVEDVYNDTPNAQFVKVLGGFTTLPWLTEQYLTSADWFAHEPDTAIAAYDVFDAFALTSYFGGSEVSNDEYRTNLLNAINDPNIDEYDYLRDLMLVEGHEGSIPDIMRLLNEHSNLLSQYDVDLIIYEGGQHIHHSAFVDIPQNELEALQEFLANFVRSPQMAELYEELWMALKDVVDGPFMQFGMIDGVSQYGSWGLYSQIGDNNPRAEMLMHLNETENPWWDTYESASFLQGVIERGDAQDNILYGTNEEDFLLGGDGNDTLVGGEGDDGLHGGNGIDRVLLRGKPADYIISENNDGYDLQGPDGNDFIYEIEYLEFADGTLLSVIDFSESLFTEEGNTYVVNAIGDLTASLGSFDLDNDVLDISDILSGYDALTNDINDFVNLTQVENNVTISVDNDGLDNGISYQDLITFTSVDEINLEALIMSGALTV